MDNKRFKDEIYTPYNEAWSLIKVLQNFKSSDPKDNDAWNKWVADIDSFREKYKNNQFALTIYRMLLDAGEEIGKMNE